MPYHLHELDDYSEKELERIQEFGDHLHDVFVHVVNGKVNTHPTRETIARVMDSHLQNFKIRKALTEFEVVCNEQNNGMSIIERGDVHVDVYFKLKDSERLDPSRITYFASYV